jgi:hypothetical protein
MPRDFLDAHARTRERARRLETGVHKLPPGIGRYGRRSGWMKMTPVPPAEYTDPAAPARRLVYADMVRVVCPGLDAEDGDHRIFQLGPSARPNYIQTLALEGADRMVVRRDGSFTAYGITGTLSFDVVYALG